MAKSKLGIYIISLTTLDAVQYFTIAQPRIAVSMDHNLDAWRAIKQASPNSFVIGRYYVDDPEQVFDNPESNAESFFNRMKPTADRMRGVYDAWMGYNESVVKTEGEARLLSRFYARWGDLMRAANLISCAYSFSTGNPFEGDLGPDGNPEPNLWPILADGLKHCDLLSLHEYSARTMDNMQPYLCLRYRKAMSLLPADARRQIVITETGIDGGVIDEPGNGWRKYQNEAGYLSTLRWYDAELQKDDYVIGGAIFCAGGFGNADSFAIAGATSIRDYMGQGGAPTPVVIKPPVPSLLDQVVQQARTVHVFGTTNVVQLPENSIVGTLKDIDLPVYGYLDYSGVRYLVSRTAWISRLPNFFLESATIPSSEIVSNAAIAAALKLTWMPINTDAALYKFAQQNSLGYPQTDEFGVVFNNANYIGQVFNGGIVYCKKGDYANVKWFKKP